MADTGNVAETVQAAIDRRRRQADTKALDVSLNELADMHKNGELKIQPDYQRLFRWPLAKQSQFIESLILELPIPPVFVIELEEGRWELIDGLQRVSSYLHFRGLLDAPSYDPPIRLGQQLRLSDCDIIPELNGLTYEDERFPASMRIRLKRAFMRVELVRKGTDQRFRYYMFKRLNTGGEVLSEQEIRNCTIRLLGDRFNVFIQERATDEAFQICIDALTTADRQKMGNVELVLRFFAFKNYFNQFRHDIGPFLTDYMERVTDAEGPRALPFDYALEGDCFQRVFQLLSRTLAEDTCKRWTGQRFGGGFSNHHFEACSLGVAKVIDEINVNDAGQLERIKQALINAKKDEQFQALTTGGGKNSPEPYRSKIQFVENAVRGAL